MKIFKISKLFCQKKFSFYIGNVSFVDDRLERLKVVPNFKISSDFVSRLEF